MTNAFSRSSDHCPCLNCLQLNNLFILNTIGLCNGLSNTWTNSVWWVKNVLVMRSKSVAQLKHTFRLNVLLPPDHTATTSNIREMIGNDSNFWRISLTAKLFPHAFRTFPFKNTLWQPFLLLICCTTRPFSFFSFSFFSAQCNLQNRRCWIIPMVRKAEGNKAGERKKARNKQTRMAKYSTTQRSFQHDQHKLSSKSTTWN